MTAAGKKMEKLREEGRKIKKEINKKTVTYIVTALGIVTGLAWNDAIKSLIEYFFPLAQNTLMAKFVYAILMTIVLAIVAIYLTRIFIGEGKKEESKDKK
jgi:hypothetical protein